MSTDPRTDASATSSPPVTGTEVPVTTVPTAEPIATPPGEAVPPAPLAASAIATEEPEYRLTAARRAALLGSLTVNNLVLFATYAGVIAVLLPQQVAVADPAGKVNALAAVTAVSAFATLFVQPIVGALSDRTRARLGRRSPWILFGGIGGGICTIAMQFGTTVFLIAITWVVAQVLLNALQGPTAAIIGDRIETSRRGFTSAFAGIGTAIGAAAGIAFAGRMLASIGVAYWVLGSAVIAMSVLFVIVNPDRSSRDREVAPFRWGAFVKGFWISPRKHPDYAWAFGGRFFMVLGSQAVSNYMLYILMDYVHMPLLAAGALMGTLSLITVVTSVIGTLVFGRLSDRLSRRKVFVVVATFIIAGALVIPLVSPTPAAIIAYSVISSIGAGAYGAVDLALMIDVLPSRGDMAKDLGVLNVAANVPQTVTPVFAALLLGIFAGNYASIFVYAMVAVALSSLFILPIKKVR